MNVESEITSLLDQATVWIDGGAEELRAVTRAIRVQLEALGPDGIAAQLRHNCHIGRVVLRTTPPDTPQDIRPHTVAIMYPGIADDPEPPCVVWWGWVRGSAVSGATREATEVLTTWMHRVAREEVLAAKRP